MAPSELLTEIAQAGYEGAAFPTVTHLRPGATESDLRGLMALSADLGLTLRFGVGCIGPDGDDAGVLAKIEARLRGGRLAGGTEFVTYTETRRGPGAESRQEQLDTASRRLRALLPLLDRLGCRLDLKTHEDIDSDEVLAVVGTVGSPVVGVCLDVANLVVRGEDPVAAAARLAAHVRQVHLEDIGLCFVADGVRRQLLPCGQGVLDWPGLAAVLRRCAVGQITLEQHQAVFDIPLFRREWFAEQEHVRPEEIGALSAMAWRTEQLRTAGTIPPAPTQILRRTRAELVARFAQSAAFVRSWAEETGWHTTTLIQAGNET